MATSSDELPIAVTETLPLKHERFNLDKIITKPTWKEILLELIATRRLDPWNVDIVLIAEGFLKKIREMEKLDLLVPANIILAASILLRYKSDYIRFEEPQAEVIMPLDEGERVFESVPQLELSARIPPKRQITLDELMGEMERVIKYDNGERTIRQPKPIDIVHIAVKDFDIDKKMEEVFAQIETSIDEQGWTMFSRIIPKNERTEIMYVLLSLLHLTQSQKVDIRQDEIFGDIFIQVLKEKK